MGCVAETKGRARLLLLGLIKRGDELVFTGWEVGKWGKRECLVREEKGV
jgi:hypothetical protein